MKTNRVVVKPSNNPEKKIPIEELSKTLKTLIEEFSQSLLDCF